MKAVVLPRRRQRARQPSIRNLAGRLAAAPANVERFDGRNTIRGVAQCFRRSTRVRAKWRYGSVPSDEYSSRYVRSDPVRLAIHHHLDRPANRLTPVERTLPDLADS